MKRYDMLIWEKTNEEWEDFGSFDDRETVLALKSDFEDCGAKVCILAWENGKMVEEID